MSCQALKGRLASVLILLITGCLSPDLTIKTSGTFNGTYVSVEGSYSGPLFFDYEQEQEEIEVEGAITVNEERLEFTGAGTLSKNPAELDLDVSGTDFTMHIEGALVNGCVQGSYTFNSSRWGNHSGSVNLRNQ